MGDHSDNPSPSENLAATTGSESPFDRAAQSWDDNLVRVQLATAVAEAMARELPLDSQMQIMDFGSGTGLIARTLAPQVRLVMAADTSAEMLAVLESKAKAIGMNHIKPLLLDAGYESHAGVCYNAIVSSMVLHHIEDIPNLLGHMARWCRPGGWVALADLEPEDGSFHRHHEEVFHHGFNPAALALQLEAVGFVTKSVRTVHTIQRPPAQGGELRDYPVFLLVAQRSSS